MDKVVDMPVIVHVLVLVQTAQFCAVLDKVVDLPVMCKFRGWSRQCRFRAVLGPGR